MKKIGMLFSLIVLITTLVTAQNKRDEMLLESLGALSGQNMYLTYMALGNVADTYGSGLYKAEFAVQLADELKEMITMTIKQYNDMLTSGNFIDDDYNSIMKFVDVYTALEEEASGLREMVVVASEENIKKFEVGRQKAWKLVSEILGLSTQ